MTRVNGNPHGGRYGCSHTMTKDTGYTKVCPDCCTRYASEPGLAGKSRYVDLVTCQKCRIKAANIIKARNTEFMGARHRGDPREK